MAALSETRIGFAMGAACCVLLLGYGLYIDRALNLIQVSIKEIDFAGCGLNPRTAVHPRAPFIKACDNWRAFRHFTGDAFNVANRKRVGLCIVDTHIKV